MTLNITGTADVTSVAWIGPMAVFWTAVCSYVSTRVWNRLIGEMACRWRVAYAPDNRVYAIWVVLYTATAIVVVLQWLALAVPHALVVLDWWTNAGWAAAWLLSAVWVVLFDKEEGCNFWASALVLLAASASAVAAVASEGAWQTGAAGVVTAAPLALLAGWLLVAAALNIGTALRSASAPEDCRAYVHGVHKVLWLTPEEHARRIGRALVREEAARTGALRSSWERAPLVLLALVVAALAFVAYEPLLPLPLLWALLLQPGLRCPPRAVEAAAFAAAIAGVALAAVRVGDAHAATPLR